MIGAGRDTDSGVGGSLGAGGATGGGVEVDLTCSLAIVGLATLAGWLSVSRGRSLTALPIAVRPRPESLTGSGARLCARLGLPWAEETEGGSALVLMRFRGEAISTAANALGKVSYAMKSGRTSWGLIPRVQVSETSSPSSYPHEARRCFR
jgi:hypothetical protein